MRKREKILYEESGLFIFMRKMNSSRWKDAGLVFAYMIFYLCFFNYLEHRTGVQVHMLQMRADSKVDEVIGKKFADQELGGNIVEFLFVVTGCLFFFDLFFGVA